MLRDAGEQRLKLSLVNGELCVSTGGWGPANKVRYGRVGPAPLWLDVSPKFRDLESVGRIRSKSLAKIEDLSRSALNENMFVQSLTPLRVKAFKEFRRKLQSIEEVEIRVLVWKQRV